MDKSGNDPDAKRFAIDRAKIKTRAPGGPELLVNKWRVRSIEERWFFFDDKKSAEEFVRLFSHEIK